VTITGPLSFVATSMFLPGGVADQVDGGSGPDVLIGGKGSTS